MSGIHNWLDYVSYAVDIIVNIGFLLDAIVRVISIPMSIRIENACGRNVDKVQMLFMNDSFVTIPLIVLSLSIGLTPSGYWCRIARLVILTPTFLETFPHLSILLSSITRALGSISVTIMIFVYSLLVYGAFGHLLFSVNDPFHFGTYSLSLWTFFHFAVFDNWSELWYINFGGCNSFPSELNMDLNHDPVDVVSTHYGTFQYPVCVNPIASPVTSTIIFVSFTFIVAYVGVNMIMAAVVIGVKQGLDEFRHVDLYGTESKINVEEGIGASNRTNEDGASVTNGGGAGAGSANGVVVSGNTGGGGGKRNSVIMNDKILKMVGKRNETEQWKKLLESVWAGVTVSKDRSYFDIIKTYPWYALPRLKVEFERILTSSLYSAAYITCCTGVLVIEVSIYIIVILCIFYMYSYLLDYSDEFCTIL